MTPAGPLPPADRPLRIPAGRVPVCQDRVVVGPCACAAPITELLIESLGPQDDDLRADVLRQGRAAWETLSDTRLNVSAYFGETESPDRAIGFNNAWPTAGFRVLRIGSAARLRTGDLIRLWVADLGGGCQCSPCRVTIRPLGGPPRNLIVGYDLSITPPAWPPGTIGPSEELVKTAAQRPWQAPGSPPVYVPLAQFPL